MLLSVSSNESCRSISTDCAVLSLEIFGSLLDNAREYGGQFYTAHYYSLEELNLPNFTEIGWAVSLQVR